ERATAAEHLMRKQRKDSATAILGLGAEDHDAARLQTLFGCEEFEQSRRQKTTIADRLERMMEIGHDDHESRWLAVDFGHERELGKHDVLEHFGFMQEAVV